MTANEFRGAFTDTNIVVVTRSGRLYYVHEDQLEGVRDDSLIYGAPLKRHPRDNHSARWFALKNVRVAEADDQVNV